MFRCRCLLTLVVVPLVVVQGVYGQSGPADIYGDPLPEGAVARLGTLRFRHKEQISFAAFLPGGKTVIAVSDDGGISVWEFPSGKEVVRFSARVSKEGEVAPTFKGVSAAALAPDGKTIAASFAQTRTGIAKGKGAAGFERKSERAGSPEIHIHDIASGKELGVLKSEGADVNALVFSPDGRQLTAWCSDRFIRIWDWAEGKQIGKAATVGAPPVAKTTTESPFSSMAAGTTASTTKGGAAVYGPDGKTILIYGGAKSLQFVDGTTGKEIGPSAGHSAPLTAIAFTSDGRTLVTQDAKTTRLWEATGKGLGTIPVPAAASGGPAIISADGKIGVSVERFATPTDARAAETRNATVFDTASGKTICEIGLDVEITPIHRRPLLFSPDGKVLAASAGGEGEVIHLYDTTSGKLLRTLDADGIAKAPAKGKGFKGAAPPGKAGPGAASSFFGATSHKILFLPDGKMLAFQPSASAGVVWFDTVSGKKLGSTTPTKAGSTSLGAFTPDGRCLALQSITGGVTLIELATGQTRRTYGAKTPPPMVDDPPDPDGLPFGPTTSTAKAKSGFALSPDGRMLAFAGVDGAVVVLDVMTARELAAFRGHLGAVNAVAFSPDGKTLASAGADATALIWDVSRVARPAPAAKAPQPADLDASWQALAGDDAGKAFSAMADLAGWPKEAVALIRDQVKAAAPLDRKRVDELIAQLSDSVFKTRELATVELTKLGDQFAPVIEAALAGSPPPEAQRRLEAVRAKISVLTGERLRAYRAVEVLQHLGTPEARAELERLAAGAPGAILTASARKALGR